MDQTKKLVGLSDKLWGTGDQNWDIIAKLQGKIDNL